MALSTHKTTYCLAMLWALCQCVSTQSPKGKVELLAVVAKMRHGLTEVGESIDVVAKVEMSNYFDETTTWRLLPKETFRAQLLECSVHSGYLAFQHLLFDQITSYLPAKVFYATFNTKYVNDNFSNYEQSCKTWTKNKLTDARDNCDSKLPAVCLTPTQTSRSEALMHNWTSQMFQGEIKTFQTVLDTLSTIITQGTPAKILFEEDFFASTLLNLGEALSESKTLIASQVGLLKPPTFVSFQNLRFQMFALVQHVLVTSLPSWRSMQEAVSQSPSDPQATLNQTDSSLQEIQRQLTELKQGLSEVKTTSVEGSGLSGMTEKTPDPLMPVSSSQNVTKAFCKDFFAGCRTKIFPSNRTVTIENFLKFSFVNFYLAVGWALLMFFILIASIVYTYKQHLRVQSLSGHIMQPTRPPVSKEQQPLLPTTRIDMTKLGTALNRPSHQ